MNGKMGSIKSNISEQQLLIEPHFLPSIRFFYHFLNSQTVIFDDVSRFRKQSFCNRALISGANKVQTLIVPVKQGKTTISYAHVEIDDSFNWQRIHWNSIVSAYNKSPFFMYFKDDFAHFFTDSCNNLFELNLALIQYIMRLLHLENYICKLSEITHNDEVLDLRFAIHPKAKYNKPDADFQEIEHWQVFQEKLDFIAGLSIIDLIFNYGPESRSILEACRKSV